MFNKWLWFVMTGMMNCRIRQDVSYNYSYKAPQHAHRWPSDPIKLECTPTTGCPRSPQPPTTDRHKTDWAIRGRLSALQLWDERLCRKAFISRIWAPEDCWFSAMSAFFEADNRLLYTWDDRQVRSAVRLSRKAAALSTVTIAASRPPNRVGDHPPGSRHSQPSGMKRRRLWTVVGQTLSNCRFGP